MKFTPKRNMKTVTTISTYLLSKYAMLAECVEKPPVAAVVKAAIADTGATSKKDMGRVMKEVMARVKGQADGKLVSRLVGAALP